MTKTHAKTGGRETLKDGMVSKLQRHIVTQRKLLIVFNLISSRFMTTNYWTLLYYRLAFACVSEPRGPLLVDFYMFRTLCHNLATIHLAFNYVYTSVKQNSSPFQEKGFTCKFRHERTTHSKTLRPFLHYESMKNLMTLKIWYIDNQ